MDKINWCFNTKNGFELVEPNRGLAEAYIKKAEESLETMRLAKSRDWQVSTAYYTLYFSVYAILMKIGVKCEIHSCTIEFAKRFLSDCLDKEDLELLEDSFAARIDAQYYVDKDVPGELHYKIMKEAPKFMVKCKDISIRLDEKTINGIRNKLETAQNNACN